MMVMTPNQIKHMVDRFLGWKLPESFSPDAGISFNPTFNEHTPHPMKHQPCGTNLFDASQAEAMVLHMIDGLPTGIRDDLGRAELLERVRMAMVASCTCLTKTPEPEHHDEGCRYRVLADVEKALSV